MNLAWEGSNSILFFSAQSEQNPKMNQGRGTAETMSSSIAPQ